MLAAGKNYYSRLTLDAGDSTRPPQTVVIKCLGIKAFRDGHLVDALDPAREDVWFCLQVTELNDPSMLRGVNAYTINGPDPASSGGSTILLGYKGKQIMDEGYIYAPYVPLSTNPCAEIPLVENWLLRTTHLFNGQVLLEYKKKEIPTQDLSKMWESSPKIEAWRTYLADAVSSWIKEQLDGDSQDNAGSGGVECSLPAAP